MEGPIKILMTTDTVGGVWTYAVNLCRALSPTLAEIHLLALGGLPDKHQRNQIRQLPHVMLYESAFKLEWMESPWQDVAGTCNWIDSIYNKILPDLIHFNNYVEPKSNWHCPIITVFHSCVQTWWKAVKKEPAPVEWILYNAHVANALSASNATVFPTKHILEQAQTHYGALANAHIIYNGINTAELYESDKTPYILSVGRLWDDAKNMQMLSTAAQQVSWPVFLAGNQNCSSTAETDWPNVILLGQLPAPELQKYLAGAAIFTSPSIYEPFGLAVLEAAFSGCALALSDIGTFTEIWGDAAVYFDPDDTNSIAHTIQKLAENPQLREKMSLKAKARAQTYTAKKMASEYLNLYRALLRPSRRQLTNTQHT